MDADLNNATLFVRGAGGGQGSATGNGTSGNPVGRATLFSHSNFNTGIDGALGGSGEGRLPASRSSPERSPSSRSMIAT